MSRAFQAVRQWRRSWLEGWNRFWFTPTDPATLSLIRILAGAMLLYTHLVWSLDLSAFFGPDAWVSMDWLSRMQQESYRWSHLTWIDRTGSTALLWVTHIAVLGVFVMLTIGLFSRVTSVFAFLLTVSYFHRLETGWFGLDLINLMLAMYLVVGPCGARYSVDRWLADRKSQSGKGSIPRVLPSWSANLAIRLMQVHLCVIYFFAGARKLAGETWWSGYAMWLSVANLEYQSIDMTWMANWPSLLACFTHLTVFFEVSYAALIWPRLTRPLILLLAVWLHLGISLFLGMATFGLVMLIANVAFLSPDLVRGVLEWRPRSSLESVSRVGNSTPGRTD